MSERVVLVSYPEKHVLMLTLSRPKSRNAVTEQMINELVEELDKASSNKDVRAVVVTGDPDARAFSAGADLSGMENRVEGSQKQASRQDVSTFRDAGGFSSLAALRCSKPIIAAINGAAVGWGLAVTLACDLRVVADDAKCGFTMAARGLVNESLSSYLLPRLIGAGNAKELVFTGRVFRARDAVPGLFNYVVPQEQVLRKALDLACEISANASGLSVALCKTLMDVGWDSSPEQAFLNESKCLHYVQKVRTEDLQEGISSFFEKRAPQWKLDANEDLPDFLPLRQRINVKSNSKL
uniref:Enoyl-CoA hydratase n=2 Tax=Aplanochytrium stocchinoi TaxID=215587 RepID=A0A7S3PIV2_9STRA